MWRLLKAELLYQWYTLAAFLALAVMVFAYGEGAAFLGLLIPFMMVNTLVPFRGREKRDRLQAMLPAPLAQIAAARILLVILPCLVWYTLFLTLGGLFREVGLNDLRSVIVFFSWIVAGYAATFAVNDTFLLSRSSTKMILLGFLALGTTTAMLGAIVFGKLSENPEAFDLKAIIEAFQANNPFAGLYGNLLFLMLSLALAALSIVTYTRRKSHLCTE